MQQEETKNSAHKVNINIFVQEKREKMQNAQTNYVVKWNSIKNCKQ